MSCYFCRLAERGKPYVSHRHIPRPKDEPIALLFGGAIMAGLPTLLLPDGSRR